MLTSPITHEKIIEVLREALTAIDAMRYVNRGTVTPENAFAQFNVRNKQACEVYDIARAALEAARNLYQRLQAENQEGGDAAEVRGRSNEDTARASGPHVAPPASANAGTGRATARRIIEEHIGGKNCTAIYSRMVSDIAEALTSEHQRGLAEGERIGIEKAAKVADEEHALRGQYGAAEAASRIGARIRALTGDPQT